MSARRTSTKGSSSFQNQSDQSEQYQVEKIINKKVENNTKMYKVVWAGYDIKQATWEPQENLAGCKHKIQQFEIYYQEVKRKQQDQQKKRQPNRKFNHLPNPEQLKRLIMTPTSNILKTNQQKQSRNFKNNQVNNRDKPDHNQQKQVVIPTMFTKPLKYSIQPPSRSTLNQNFQQYSKIYQKNIQKTLNPIKGNGIQRDGNQNMALKKKPITSQQDNTSQQAQKQEQEILYLSDFYTLNITQIVGAKAYCGEDSGKISNIEFLIVKKRNSQRQFYVPKHRIMKQAPKKLLQFYQKLLEK